MRAKIWEHFQTLAAMGHDDKIAEEKLLEGENHRHGHDDQDHCKDHDFHRKYEIADICFGR